MQHKYSSYKGFSSSGCNAQGFNHFEGDFMLECTLNTLSDRFLYKDFVVLKLCACLFNKEITALALL